MTEYKPFSAELQEPQPEERSVAAVLSLPSANEDPAGLAWRKIGDLTLAEIALRTLGKADVDERWVLDSMPEVPKLFNALNLPGVGLLRPGDPANTINASHLLLIGPFHPFLRSSSIEEAVRLFKMRPDIGSMVTCVRHRDALLDEHGATILDENDERIIWRSAHAFEIVAAKPSGRSAPSAYDPFPFEISSQEAFLIDGDFEFGLYGAWRAQRSGA